MHVPARCRHRNDNFVHQDLSQPMDTCQEIWSKNHTSHSLLSHTIGLQGQQISMHFYQSLMLLCFRCLIHATHKHSQKGLTIHSPKHLGLCRCGVQAHYDWAPVKRVQPSLETGLFPSWLRMICPFSPRHVKNTMAGYVCPFMSHILSRGCTLQGQDHTRRNV